STMLPVFFGGLLRLFMERGARNEEERTARRDRGILFGSGLVGGEGLIGVVIAGAAGYAVSRDAEPWSVGHEWAGAAAEWLALALFVGLAVYFARLVTRGGAAAQPSRSRSPRSAAAEGGVCSPARGCRPCAAQARAR